MHFGFSLHFPAFSTATSARILVAMTTLRLYQVAMGAGSWPAAACYVPCQACQAVAGLILGALRNSPSYADPFFMDGTWGGKRGQRTRNTKRQETVAWGEGGGEDEW